MSLITPWNRRNQSISLDRDDLMRLLLELVRKMTSAAHDGGMDEWLRDYSIRDMMIVEFTDGSLTK